MYDIIEQVIAGHFGITQDALLTDSKRGASDARHFLWYVLHVVAGYSSRTIAARYHTSVRNVLYYSAVIREGIRHQPYFSEHYKDIQAKLRMLDII